MVFLEILVLHLLIKKKKNEIRIKIEKQTNRKLTSPKLWSVVTLFVLIEDYVWKKIFVSMLKLSQMHIKLSVSYRIYLGIAVTSFLVRTNLEKSVETAGRICWQTPRRT